MSPKTTEKHFQINQSSLILLISSVLVVEDNTSHCFQHCNHDMISINPYNLEPQPNIVSNITRKPEFTKDDEVFLRVHFLCVVYA